VASSGTLAALSASSAGFFGGEREATLEGLGSDDDSEIASPEAILAENEEKYREIRRIDSVSDFCYFIGRGAWLFACFAPLVTSYPILVVILPKIGLVGMETTWWEWYYLIVTISGPTVVKLYQWAATRRDIFSDKFCHVFSELHSGATPHSWEQTKKILDEAVAGWQNRLCDFGKAPIGSGCIGQVYRAYDRLTEVDVAVKVLHPGIRKKVTYDMFWIKWTAYLLDSIPSFHWLSFQEHVTQFEQLMHRQLDLRYEAHNLRRFHQNFAAGGGKRFAEVRFPEPLLEITQQNVLVETYEKGITLAKYFSSSKANDAEEEAVGANLRKYGEKKIARIGCDAFIKMLFEDNFIHGDLHPGNILVSFPHLSRGQSSSEQERRGEEKDNIMGQETPLAGVMAAVTTFIKSPLEWVRMKVSRLSGKEELDDDYATKPRVTFLDAGIVNELRPKDWRNFIDVFTAVVNRRGHEVGRLILERSPHQECPDPERYARDVEKLVNEATRTNIQLSKLQVGVLLTEVLNLSRYHRVKLDSAFTPTILAVVIIEGIGRSLDPDLDILSIARRALVSPQGLRNAMAIRRRMAADEEEEEEKKKALTNAPTPPVPQQ